MKLLAVLSLVLVTGCTTTSKMNIVDLNHYKIDCARKEEQLAFLQRQFPSEQDRWTNAFRMTSVVGTAMSVNDGTYLEERATFDNRQQAVARYLIYQIRNNCRNDIQRAQGCTHINEEMPSGSAQGAVCYQNRQSTAVVKRWGVID